MADIQKKVHAAAVPMLMAGEEVLAGMYVVPAPQLRFGIGAGTGMAGGGLVGLAVGAAVDRHFQKEDGGDPDPGGLAGRPPVEPALPKVTGGLLVITTERLLVWALSATNKPKTLIHDYPLSIVDTVAWRRLKAGSEYLGGRINLGCTAIWIGLGDRVLPVASLGAFQEPNTAPVLNALTARRPGRVHEITD
ncbi:MAG: hypothetical protein WD652_06100 [Acidimicrobiia bacterium]